MLTSSAKQKGRKLCSELRAKFLEWAPDLNDRDIVVTPSGVTGPDLYLSPRAEEIYPYVVECKNQESINIWASIQQSQSHAIKRPELIPILCFSRNRSGNMICLRLEDFLKLTR